jgi:hypothetical protein
MSKQTDSVPENTSEPNTADLPNIQKWHKAILEERLK